MVAHRKLLLLILALLPLAGCGGATVTVFATATAPAAAALTTVDWANFTYPNSCTPTPATLTVHNGRAPLSNGDFFIVYTPIFGDVTGDGQPEAVIPNDCVGGQPRGTQFDVYTGTAAHPQLVAHLPLASDPQPDIGIGDPAKVAFGGNHTLTLGGFGYSSDAVAVCCPDLSVTDIFTWQSSQLVLTNQQRVPFTPPVNTPTP